MLPLPPTPAPFNFYAPPVPYGPPPGLFTSPVASRPPGALPPPNNPGFLPPLHTGYLGKPISHLICCSNFGATLVDTKRQCSCAIAQAFQGRVHYPF